jgi:hypothetical protein
MICAALFFSGCGQKGPPRPPVRRLPERNTDLKILQKGEAAVIVFAPVTRNTDGSSLEDLDSVVVYRMDEPMEPGKGGRYRMPGPPAENVYSKKAKKIARITHGDLPSFTEGGKVYFPVSRAVAESAPGRPPLVSFFAVKTESRRGRTSRLSNIAALAPEKVPPAPGHLSCTLSKDLCVLSWEPPRLEEGGEVQGLEGYDIFRRQEGSPYPNTPLNAKPVTGTRFEDRTLLYGEAYCYTVAALVSGRTGPVQGSAAQESCLSFRDIYPPEPPTAVSSISGRGSIRLVWEEKPGSDVAGYNIYRKAASEKDWVKINEKPVEEATFTDTDVKSGIRYEYRITALDSAEPPNESTPSDVVSDFAL